MIDSIRLQNFQSHKDTSIQFSTGVNAIVGLSDSGKTAILRALNWVYSNKPTGAEVQSHWGGETSVAVTLSEGTIIRRIRSKSTNEYWLDDQCFKAFGQDVPAEIRSALNLSGVNIQFQMDGPFLLGDAWNAGDVAQYLNQVVRLDGIDRAVSHVRKLLSAAQQGVKVEESRVADISTQLEQYDLLDAFSEAVTRLESGVAGQDILRGRQTLLQQLEDRTTTQIATQQKFAWVDDASVQVARVQQDLTTLTQEKAKAARLHPLRNAWVSQKNILDRTRRIILAEKAFTQAEATNKLIQEMIDQETALQARRKRADDQINAAASATKTVSELESQFKRLMPAVCPLCNQEVK